MAYQQLEPFSRQITIVMGLTVVGFMALALALSFYRNVLFDQDLNELESRNAQLRRGIAESRQELEYYRSVQYRDKYAKENLSVVRPGEKVLLLPASQPTATPDDGSETDSLREQEEAAYLELLEQMPIIEHWKLYFLRPQEVERLRQSFRQ